MPDIYDLANEQRDAVLSRDRAASADLVRAYAGVARRVRSEMDDLLGKITAAQAEGRPTPPSWLDTDLRLRSILRELEGHLREYSLVAGDVIAEDIKDATSLGNDHVERLVREQTRGIVSFRRLNEAALQAVVQTTNKGALADLLQSFGPELSVRLRNLLLTSLTTGRGPEVTARLIREAIGVPLSRAVTIARTESMRAYREASHRSMRENDKVLDGWYWWAKLARNTCAACWAKHGTKHSTRERLYGHPRCRCAMVPITKTWTELGFEGIPETRIEEPTPGTDRFVKLSPAGKLAVLGPTRYAAYQSGVTLDDMTYTRQSKTWGPSVALVPVSKLG